MDFLIHTPINIHGRMMGTLKNELDNIEEHIGESISFCSPHDLLDEAEFSQKWMAQVVEKNSMPEISLIPAPEFSSLADKDKTKIFSDLAGKYAKKHPIRKELSMLTDSSGMFYPTSVIPLVMIYNSETVDEKDLTHSWADLFHEKYRVMLPFRDKPMTRAAGAFLLQQFPEQFAEFEKRVRYDGYPMDGIKAVLSGECDMAMTIYSLATVGQSRGVKINPTKEGFILLPQLLAWKGGVSDSADIVAEILTERDFQEFLSEQGAWPVNGDVDLPESIVFDGCLKNWKGWDNYFKEVEAFDNFRVERDGEKICS